MKNKSALYCFVVVFILPGLLMANYKDPGHVKIEKVIHDRGAKFAGCSWSEQECYQTCRGYAEPDQNFEYWCIESQTYCDTHGQMFQTSALCNPLN